MKKKKGKWSQKGFFVPTKKYILEMQFICLIFSGPKVFGSQFTLALYTQMHIKYSLLISLGLRKDIFWKKNALPVFDTRLNPRLDQKSLSRECF